jgi:O-antigen/teichoic acid export membrane protein
MIRPLLNKFFYDPGVVVLLSGTVLAQLVPLFVAPALTRTFTPDQFGALALLMAWFNPLSYFASGRYDVAVVLPKEENEARHLVIGGILIALLLALLVSGVEGIAFLLGLRGEFSVTMFVILPLLLFFTGIYQPLSFYLQRHKRYKFLAISKVSQTSVIALSSLVLGFLGYWSGLMWGYLSGWIILGIVSMIYFFNSGLHRELNPFAAVKLTLKKYKDYPLINAPTSFLHALTISIPVFLITEYFSRADAGYLNLARQILIIPTSLIATAFSQVYFESFARAVREQQAIGELLRSKMKPLFVLALCFLIPLLFFAPQIFQWYFGEQWELSGIICASLAPVMALQFLVLPISSLLPAIGKIRITAAWQLSYFLLILALWFFKDLSLRQFILVYALIDLLAYFVFLLIILRFASKFDKQLSLQA